MADWTKVWRSNEGGEGTYAMPVPGGLLIRHVTFGENEGAVAMQFVPCDGQEAREWITANEVVTQIL